VTVLDEYNSLPSVPAWTAGAKGKSMTCLKLNLLSFTSLCQKAEKLFALFSKEM